VDGRRPVLGGTFTPDDESIAAWRDHWRAVWTAHLRAIDPRYEPSLDCERANCKCQGQGHAIDFKAIETVADVEEIGEYLVKTQDGRDPGQELTRLDMKSAQGHGMTPFEMIGRLGDLMGGMDPDDPAVPGHGTEKQCFAWWREYEPAVKGRRAIEWTRGLRALLGIDGGDTDEDDKAALDAADATSPYRAGIRIASKAWNTVTGRALDFAVTEMAEGTDGIDAAAVQELVTAAGGPLWSITALTPGEVDEAYAGMLATLAQRREMAAERRREAAARASGDVDQEDVADC
jgi:hypothetical protein